MEDEDFLESFLDNESGDSGLFIDDDLLFPQAAIPQVVNSSDASSSLPTKSNCFNSCVSPQGLIT